MTKEAQAVADIRSAYARRRRIYDSLSPSVYLPRQERERAIIKWMRQAGMGPTGSIRLLELGCGAGGNLLDFLRIGVLPQNMVGNDLLEERIDRARNLLPLGVRLIAGDCSEIDLANGSFDVVFQSMMCTSILDRPLLERVARRMWELARPGGGVLWYDFTYDNPANPDVRGLSLSDLESLFPAPIKYKQRVTLAPPVARVATRVHPVLYGVLNCLPLLRTHVLCWIEKPAG